MTRRLLTPGPPEGSDKKSRGCVLSNRPNTRLIRSPREQFAAITCQVNAASSPGGKSASAEDTVLGCFWRSWERWEEAAGLLPASEPKRIRGRNQDDSACCCPIILHAKPPSSARSKPLQEPGTRPEFN